MSSLSFTLVWSSTEADFTESISWGNADGDGALAALNAAVTFYVADQPMTTVARWAGQPQQQCNLTTSSLDHHQFRPTIGR